MKYFQYFLFVALISPPFSASALGLEDIRKLWKEGAYPQVIQEALTYRDLVFGKNIEVDYMLATSFCRHTGEEHIGRAFLNHILRVYEISDENRVAITSEQDRCPEQAKPVQLAFLTSRSTGGGDSVVRGKSFHFIDKNINRALGGDPAKVIKEIPEQILLARLFKRDDQVSAAKAMAERLGSQSRIHMSEHFVIGSLSNHSSDQLKEISRLIEKALDFFVTRYEIKLPEKLISIYLMPDARMLREMGEKLHGLRLAQGTIGYSYINDLSLSAVVRGPYTGTLKHELTHLLVRTNFGDIPPWLDEGLAALYEVSRQEDDFLRGLPNWREEVLKRLWDGEPEVSEILGMNWVKFDAHGENLRNQGVNHALARYWLLFLQEKELLTQVYKTVRERDILTIKEDPSEDAAFLINNATGKNVNQLEEEFLQWYEQLTRALTNKDVKDIQQRLKMLGYDPGPADGLAGRKTIRAVKAFQQNSGVDADGQLNTTLLGLVKSKTGR